MYRHFLVRFNHNRITTSLAFKWQCRSTTTKHKRYYTKQLQSSLTDDGSPRSIPTRTVNEEENASGSVSVKHSETKTNVNLVKDALAKRAVERHKAKGSVKLVNSMERKVEAMEKRQQGIDSKNVHEYNLCAGQRLDMTDATLNSSKYVAMQRLLHPYFAQFHKMQWSTHHREALALGHHFVYIDDQSILYETDLLDDGYDVRQSPGKEWPRRLWSHGKILIPKGAALETGALVTIAPIVTKVEGNVGENDDEVVTVEIERKFYNINHKNLIDGETPFGLNASGTLNADSVQYSRQQLEPQPLLIESRTLVYMKQPFIPSTVKRLSKVKLASDFSLPIRITPVTLFRYSALTYNAHRIHYDTEYARKEGYEGLLVHGPLQVTFVLEFLRIHLLMTRPPKHGNNVRWKIESFEYKCLAPLYAKQYAKLCVKLFKEEGMRASYRLWIEGESGELYMRGRAQVVGSRYRFCSDMDYVNEKQAMIKDMNTADKEADKEEGDQFNAQSERRYERKSDKEKVDREKLYKELEEEHNDFRTCY